MSTVARINFEPVSSILDLWRRDLPLQDPGLALPDNAVALTDGEWVTLNTAEKLVRAADVATPGTLATVRSFPVFQERGRSDRLGMGEKKTTHFFRGEWLADTRIYDASAALGSGAAITAVLQPLKVATITIGTRNFVGLVGHGGSADVSPVVGYVVKLPANNGGKLRVMSGYRS